MAKITSNADLYNSDYEELTARFELYGALKQGLDDVAAGRVVSAEDAKAMFREKYPGANIC